ncbi:tRNA threonylcarbamoyladenosine dehydratase [Clostridium sp.]|uniref:tRNA threonylcarbamoyladenosine dehydratase n=1 Tax=Clostridium sp. TaxID=1506 RepID=UPI002633B116|nr:tRNA threonylcarbamoyladenosine dehydratase [Clostridium sp.]
MSKNPLSRTELLVGPEGIEKLKNAKVMVFGVGGVGSFVVESLARTGIGTLILVDNDTVDITNLNRQVLATHDTVDRVKVDVMKERILSVNKDCNVITHEIFVTKDNVSEIVPLDIDYVVDAIDTITAKLYLAKFCYDNNIKIISSMGTGNKMDPTQFKVTDVYKTKVCPLAKVMRYELKRLGVKKLKVVYSEEKARIPYFIEGISKEVSDPGEKVIGKRSIPGSIGFVPPVAGMILASQVVRYLIGDIE